MNTTDLKSCCCRQRGRFGKWLLGRKLRKLKLDDTQQNQLDQLLARGRKASRNHEHAGSDLHECIGNVIADNDFDHEQTAAHIKSAAEHYVADATAVVTAFSEFCRQLEPWQRKQLQQLWQQRGRCASRFCH